MDKFCSLWAVSPKGNVEIQFNGADLVEVLRYNRNTSTKNLGKPKFDCLLNRSETASYLRKLRRLGWKIR